MPEELVSYRSSLGQEKDVDRFKVFPNPNSGLFTIEDLSDKDESKNYAIYNVQSQMVAEGQFQGNRLSIDLNDLPKGVYFLELNVASADSKELIRVIVE